MKILPITNYSNNFRAKISPKKVLPQNVLKNTTNNKEKLTFGVVSTMLLTVFTLIATLCGVAKCTRECQEKAVVEHVLQNDTLRVVK